jgi:(S)-3,5-dihydroxyphenylglycine transaminase
MCPQPIASPRPIQLNACLHDPLLDAMNFLNEDTWRFPDAISFAPGRPLDRLLDVERHLEALPAYVADYARRLGMSTTAAWNELGQYAQTNGSIKEVIAAHVEQDERIRVEPDAVIVTVGAQEAMAIVLIGLFDREQDVLLVSDPTYVGITGLARLLGIRVMPVATGQDGLDPAVVEAAILEVGRSGRARALYDIPDFNNPLGTSMPRAHRERLLDVCRRHDVLIIEDNPYGMFAYDGDRQPTLKSLDADRSVLYIGSFAKTICPGLRLGYLLADQPVTPGGHTLATELSKVKSLITVNTPPLMQALAASALTRAGGSLEPLVAPMRAQYRRHRDAMVAGLAAAAERVDHRITWTVPAGGFFLTVTLPFAFGAAELQECAAHYGVIVSPMQMFCLDVERSRQIRLSFSSVEPPTIATGIERLARFIAARA